MFNCFKCKSSTVYIVYKLKQKKIDTVIEETTINKLNKRLINLKSSNYIYDKIVCDTNMENAIKKFYN